MVKPMTPQEGMGVKQPVPDFVIEAVNELLKENLRDGKCKLTQDEIMERVLTKTTLDRTEIFDNHYLDFEDQYRELGWSVEYDKPAYYETYSASFTFDAN